MGILVLFLIFKGMLSVFFTIEYDISCGFVMYGLYYVEICSLCAHFLENVVFCFFFFNHKWMLDFIKSFFCICWDDNMISSVCYCVFMDIEKPSLISEVNPT